MIKLAIVFMLGSLTSLVSVAAEIDYAAGAGARSFPLGVSAFAQAGYGMMLWGERHPGEFRYGYVRPYVRARSSVLVSRGEVALELRPISLVGLDVGYEYGTRSTDIDTLDCVSVGCRGSVYGPFARLSFLGGFDRIYFGGAARWSWLSSSISDRPFGDDSTALAGAPGGDRLMSAEAFAGARVADGWGVGLMLAREQMMDTAQSNILQSLFVRHTRNALAYTFGSGTYRSSTAATGLTVFALVTWTGVPSLDLQ